MPDSRDLTQGLDPIALFAGAYTPSSRKRIPETIYSALLGYFLHPKLAHGLGTHALRAFVRDLALGDEILDEKNLRQADVEVEAHLGKGVGNVDLRIELPHPKSSTKIPILIENKLRDASASNRSSEGTHQIERYLETLKHPKNQQWRFVYLVPSLESSSCRERFDAARASLEEGLRENLVLATWLKPRKPSPSVLPVACIAELLEGFPVAKLSDGAHSIHRSLQRWLPTIEEENRPTAPNRFPTRIDLLDHPRLGSLYKPWLSIGGCTRRVDPQKTTIGIPFREGAEPKDKANNWLYRLRTTSQYYGAADKKEECLENLKAVEIEIRPSQYDRLKVNPEWGAWEKEAKAVIRTDQHHLGPCRPLRCVVVALDHEIPTELVNRFDAILRQVGIPRE